MVSSDESYTVTFRLKNTNEWYDDHTAFSSLAEAIQYCKNKSNNTMEFKLSFKFK